MDYDYGEISLEKRVDSWMKGIAERIQKMEMDCKTALDAMPKMPEYNPDMSYEEEEKYFEEESYRNSFYWRKGLSKEEWKSFQTEVYKQKQEFWKEFHAGQDEDFDNSYILTVLKFKLKWMAFYWENFGHCEDGWLVIRQMKLACKLIDIILNGGLNSKTTEVLPYVNIRNKDKFYGFNDWHQPHYKLGERQEVRFRKAYCLLWELMKYNLLNWWD